MKPKPRLESAERIAIRFGEPPTANTYWRLSRGRLYRSREAKAYISDVTLRMYMAGIEPIRGTVDLRFIWYRPNRIGDLDNRIKVLQDALRHGAFGDDAKVRRLICEVSDDTPKQPGVDVVVVPFIASEPGVLFGLDFSSLSDSP